MLPASSVFKKSCNYQCLIFVFDIETDGAPVSAPRTLCVIDCECTVCVLCAIQEGWHTQTTQSAFRSLVASGPCLSGWQFFEFNERARVFRMDARAQKCHGISLQVCHCLN